MKIHKLLTTHLLLPLVESLTQYSKNHMLTLLKEILPKGMKLNDKINNSIDSSKMIQNFSKILPELFKVYFQSLPNSPEIAAAMGETMMRIKCVFVSIASFQRPMNEITKLRTAADMSVLEQSLLQIDSQLEKHYQLSPINLEYK
jgi:hypothetical protein